MKTLEEIALQVAKDAAMEISGASAAEMTPEAEAWSLAFARRLVAALGAQEPVAWHIKRGHSGAIRFHADEVEYELSPDGDWQGASVRKLYAAPVVNPDWQMVPKEHVCGLQGFGALDDVCPACESAAPEYKP